MHAQETKWKGRERVPRKKGSLSASELLRGVLVRCWIISACWASSKTKATAQMMLLQHSYSLTTLQRRLVLIPTAHRSCNVFVFKILIFQVWKVMESDLGAGKS